MKKIQPYQRVIALFLATLMLTSCSVGKSSSATAKTLDIYGAGVIHKPTLVDLEVKDTKTSGTSSGKILEKSVDVIKHEAVVNALKTFNSDVLIEPKFETETSKGVTTVSVSGFPANYKNFRAIKAEDIPLLQAGITQKAATYEPPVVTQKKSKGTGWLVAGVIAGGLLIGLAASSATATE
ncbi:MAG: hypothetical protein O9267_10290 [Flavobacterium sp.]|uniref:hypothetical protein n=1 Tax=Flavobacterium sp. TaxID=239 RepID=UPI0022BAF5C0|nr:hypothetical protein [Flavobacterium sp.]MCZ8197985.1 hypothetical protein [Flavobacterium sp.]